jgi:hypothetical protein
MQRTSALVKGHRGMPEGGALCDVGTSGRHAAADPLKGSEHASRCRKSSPAGVIRRQPGLAALPRTMAVLLSAWLIYFSSSRSRVGDY